MVRCDRGNKMIIDVLVNSCARPDILNVSFNTFRDRIKTSHQLRYVMLEDKVESHERQMEGLKWIKEHKDSFDEVIFSDKRLGPGFFFAPIVDLCTSSYFFHLEDDNEFLVDVNIDPIIDMMENNKDVVEVILNRNNGTKGTILEKDGLSLSELYIFSVATGVFNTNLTRNIIDSIGWQEQLHEVGTLTPTSETLGYKRFVLADGNKHYKHVGATKGYRKGKWRI